MTSLIVASTKTLLPYGFETDRNSYESQYVPSNVRDRSIKAHQVVGGSNEAWELMGYKGYKDGFIPYASNQLERQARTDAQT